MADGQEGGVVRPAERKHTEAVGEILFGIVVKARKEFDLLGTGTVVDGVIEDEDVDTIRARQGAMVDWMMVVASSVVNLRQWMWHEFMKR